MTAHDLTRGVAVRLSALCLTDAGKLGSYDLWDVAVRGALLVDLALAGRVVHEEDSVVVDDTPTGFAPADALLGPIAVEPERPLDSWMDRAAVGLDDVVRDNVRAGRWDVVWRTFGRRFRVWDTDDLDDDVTTPATAAVAAIGDSAGITDRRPGEPAPGLVERTGEVRWICQAVVEHLQAAHRRNLGTAWAADGGRGSPYW